MIESPFLYMKENSQTVLWNDSADQKELKDALTWGIVGATCNPVIALTALKADKDYWIGRIRNYAKNHPIATEDEIGWAMVKELSINAAQLLEPEFEKYNGRNGRVSIQTNAPVGGFFKRWHCFGSNRDFYNHVFSELGELIGLIDKSLHITEIAWISLNRHPAIPSVVFLKLWL